MALSTKDDAKTMTIKVLRPFKYRSNTDEKMKTVEIGKELEVKRPFGMEMIAAGKATDDLKADVEVKKADKK